jgi:hypothetical protein
MNKTKCCEYGPWFPSPHPKKSKVIVTKTKAEMGFMTRWLTGHYFLTRCKSAVHPEIDPKLNLFENGEEPPCHLFREYPHPIVHN